MTIDDPAPTPAQPAHEWTLHSYRSTGVAIGGVELRLRCRGCSLAFGDALSPQQLENRTVLRAELSRMLAEFGEACDARGCTARRMTADEVLRAEEQRVVTRVGQRFGKRAEHEAWRSEYQGVPQPAQRPRVRVLDAHAAHGGYLADVEMDAIPPAHSVIALAPGAHYRVVEREVYAPRHQRDGIVGTLYVEAVPARGIRGVRFEHAVIDEADAMPDENEAQQSLAHATEQLAAEARRVSGAIARDTEARVAALLAQGHTPAIEYHDGSPVARVVVAGRCPQHQPSPDEATAPVEVRRERALARLGCVSCLRARHKRALALTQALDAQAPPPIEPEETRRERGYYRWETLASDYADRAAEWRAYRRSLLAHLASDPESEPAQEASGWRGSSVVPVTCASLRDEDPERYGNSVILGSPGVQRRWRAYDGGSAIDELLTAGRTEHAGAEWWAAELEERDRARGTRPADYTGP